MVLPKRKPRMKKPSKKALEKQCLVLWSLCVRTKQRVCRLCGSDRGLQSHHIRSVSHLSTRFDLENGLCVCSREHCQQKFRPEWFQDQVIRVIGDQEYLRLKKKSLTIISDPIDLIEMKDFLKRKLDEYESDWGKG